MLGYDSFDLPGIVYQMYTAMMTNVFKAFPEDTVLKRFKELFLKLELVI